MIHKKLLVVFFMALLILLSLFPRSIEVLNGNPLFEIDQGRDYMAVKNIVVDHKLTLIGAELGAGQAGLSYLFHGPGYFYLLSIPFIFFNGNPVGGVALMLLLGLSAIAFGVYFVIKFWGIKEGLLMGFLLATCPYLIGQSRFFENHFGAPIFILIVFYFTYLFTKKPVKNYLFVFLAGLVSAFIYNLELAISVPLSISLIVYCVYLFRKQALPRLLLLMAGLAIGFSPMFLFELRHGFMGLKHLFTYLLLRPQTHTSSESMLSQAQNIYNLFILSFSDSFPGKLLAPQHIVPFIFLVFLTLIIFVLFKEKDKTKKNFLVFLLILFPVNFLVFMPLRTIVFQHYITDLTLAFLFFAVIIFSWLYKNGYSKQATLLFLYLAALVIVGGYNGLSAARSDYYDYGGVHKLKGKIDAIDFIYKDAQKQPFGLFVFTPGVYTYPYDYLVWWYGQKKYGIIPHQEKKGTFYLLIEKDSAKPWSYIGWEETVIKEGKVLFQKTLPSGLMVEKRASFAQ